jgi:hypothetical protein
MVLPFYFWQTASKMAKWQPLPAKLTDVPQNATSSFIECKCHQSQQLDDKLTTMSASIRPINFDSFLHKVCHRFRLQKQLIIFESLLIPKEAGVIAKCSLNIKPNHDNQVQLVQIHETNFSISFNTSKIRFYPIAYSIFISNSLHDKNTHLYSSVSYHLTSKSALKTISLLSNTSKFNLFSVFELKYQKYQNSLQNITLRCKTLLICRFKKNSQNFFAKR